MPVRDRRRRPRTPRHRCCGHGHHRPRRRSRAPVPRDGTGDLAVVDPGRWRPAPGPDLVRLGRRGHRHRVEARGRQGPQPARRSARDARPRRRRGRFRRRPARGPGGCPAAPAAGLPAGFEAKYAERIRALDLTPAQFARTYAQVIRLVPVKALGWHGRTTPDRCWRPHGVSPRRGLRRWPSRGEADSIGSGSRWRVGLGGLALEPARSEPRDLTVLRGRLPIDPGDAAGVG